MVTRSWTLAARRSTREEDVIRPGTPSWIDLGTTDLPAAKAFYSALFGWEIVDMGPDAAVTVWLKLVVCPSQDLELHRTLDPLTGRLTSVLPTLMRSSPRSRTREAKFWLNRLMCSILAEWLFHGSNRRRLSIWQPLKHIGSVLVNEPGTLMWNELTTREPDKALAFYPDVFGWVGEDDPNATSAYTQWMLDSAAIGGMIVMDDKWPKRSSLALDGLLQR